jgi:excisionase family DNA binding protein
MITNSTMPKNELVPPLVKVRDVAKILSISRSTVRNLIDSGDLEGSRINPCEKRRNHLRITRSSLLGFYKKRFGHSLALALANPFEP